MRGLALYFTTICVVISIADSRIYFEDNFSDGASWENHWVYSEHGGTSFGKFVLSSGKYYNNEEADKGLQTFYDEKYYAITRRFPPFSNANKNLVVQFSVKYEHDVDCVGGYVKLYNCQLNQKDMYSESPYEIMFGPDICGSKQLVHVIFSYNGRGHLIKKKIAWEKDVFSHLYTLIVKPDNTYEVLIDNKKVESGSLEEDWDLSDYRPKQPGNLYKRNEICIIGLEIWQYIAGAIFDNFLITDSIETAKEAGEKFKKTQEGEKKMKEEQDKKRAMGVGFKCYSA